MLPHCPPKSYTLMLWATGHEAACFPTFLQPPYLFSNLMFLPIRWQLDLLKGPIFVVSIYISLIINENTYFLYIYWTWIFLSGNSGLISFALFVYWVVSLFLLDSKLSVQGRAIMVISAFSGSVLHTGLKLRDFWQGYQQRGGCFKSIGRWEGLQRGSYQKNKKYIQGLWW